MKNKIKTRKSFSKRVKRKEKDFLRKKSNKGHLLRKKNSKRKRKLSQIIKLNKTQTKLAIKLIKK